MHLMIVHAFHALVVVCSVRNVYWVHAWHTVGELIRLAAQAAPHPQHLTSAMGFGMGQTLLGQQWLGQQCALWRSKAKQQGGWGGATVRTCNLFMSVRNVYWVHAWHTVGELIRLAAQAAPHPQHLTSAMGFGMGQTLLGQQWLGQQCALWRSKAKQQGGWGGATVRTCNLFMLVPALAPQEWLQRHACLRGVAPKKRALCT